MFNKKNCKKCGRKINSTYEFCPHCGNLLNGNFKEEDWGMLGKKDSFSEINEFSESMFGGIGGKMINRLLGNAMKMLENEMQKEIKKERKEPANKTNFQLFINGKRINLENNPNLIQKKKPEKPTEKVPLNSFSKEKSKKFSSLSKKEPLTKVRRLSNKVIYEIDIPGVKLLKDISLIKFENSIEIKALGKNKAYYKLIPINLPIINYNLEESKLILELGIKD